MPFRVFTSQLAQCMVADFNSKVHIVRKRNIFIISTQIVDHIVHIFSWINGWANA